MEETQNGKNSLGKILKDESIYTNLHETVAKANVLMDDINSGKGVAGRLVKDKEMADKLQNAINKLSSITDRLEAGEGSAGRFLKDPSFYNNTDQLLIESRGLVKAIRENPKKYLTIHLRIF
jgi:phospholipid/cholesterol/gamma-HCH transport system substrate-binding protein